MKGDRPQDFFDLLVIGAGVAGLTAAATAAEKGLKTIVAEHMTAGGQIATVDRITNAPGYPDGIAGYGLGPALQQQAEQAGVQFLVDTVEAILPDDDGFTVNCSDGTVRARSIIIAAGSRRKPLNVPGEDALAGRGVSHCASCDGPFFRGQDVIVAGGGDSAFDEASLLAGHAATVTIVHRGAAPTARRPQVDRVAALGNVRILGDRTITGIEGEAAVNAVTLSDGGTVPIAAVFTYIGQTPNSDFARGLIDLDVDGRIITDAMTRTSRPGIFAAGDIRAGSGGLLATAMGDGAMAALASAEFLAWHIARATR